MGAVVGYGMGLQLVWLQGFDSLGLHQVKDANSKFKNSTFNWKISILFLKMFIKENDMKRAKR
jgi:hypothetical protein